MSRRYVSIFALAVACLFTSATLSAAPAPSVEDDVLTPLQQRRSEQSVDRALEISRRDRYFYGAFYCAAAMFQLGGKYWRQFYPPLALTLIDHQDPQGNWDAEGDSSAQYGRAYSTALAVLALDTPRQLLPIFQR